ncbi:coiled-coil domain-containing protein [Chloroflexota bacterium]
MEEKTSDFEEKTTSIVKIEDMALDEIQLAEQLYNSAGLDPIVDAGLKDYDKRLQQESKLINKVLGPRGSDIRGYGESVAKRVAFAVYSLLNKQYGGKMGDLRSYVMSLEDDRDRANIKYDELMGRVIGILGDEYKELRTDSKEFIEKLTNTLGDDLKEAKIDQTALAERLADIDGLRLQISALNKEKEQIKEKNESQIAELNSKITELESDKTTLTSDLEQFRKDYNELDAAIATLAEAIPHEEMGKKLGEELYNFLLKDSKVPGAVLKGVGQFIDFKKYLGLAVESGAKEIRTRIEKILGTTRIE